MDSEHMYSDLPRRKLQLLCKQAGLRANTTNKQMAEALSKLAKTKSVAESDGPSRVTPAEPKPPTDIRLKGTLPESSEVAVGRKDAAADGGLEQAGHEVETKSEDQSQETEPEHGSVHCDTLEPVLLEARPEAEHVSRSVLVEGLEVKDEKDLLLAVESKTSEKGERSEKPAQTAQFSGAAGKDSLGGLAQELLLAEASSATAAVGSHRGLLKKTHIGQKGREDRLKRAAEKGTVERSTLIAERRGGASNQSLGQPTSLDEPTSEAAHEIAEPHAGAHPDTQIVQREPAISPPEEPDESGVKVVTEGLPTATVLQREDSVQRNGVVASEGKVEVREGASGAGAESESVEQAELEAEKENETPARASEAQKGEPVKSVEPCPGKEDTETKPEVGDAGRSLMPLGVKLAASLLTEEEREPGAPPTHKRCYKSRPISAPGVEKRVLAAAKKGAGQRDAILAERRMLS